MNKFTSALALIAITAGSLVATENMSFAATRHQKPGSSKQSIARKKGGKSRKALEDGSMLSRRAPGPKKMRRHRKETKNPAQTGSATIA